MTTIIFICEVASRDEAVKLKTEVLNEFNCNNLDVIKVECAIVED